MVVFASTWLSFNTVTGIVGMLRETESVYLALETTWAALPQIVETILRTGEERLQRDALWMVPQVLPPGFFLVTIWAMDLQTRFHRCHMTPPDNVEVWNGLMAVFWPWEEREMLPRRALEDQVQLELRQQLGAGMVPCVLRYGARENAGRSSIVKVVNESTLRQLQLLLAVAFAHTARGDRQPGTFLGGAVMVIVQHAPLSRGGERWVWQAVMRAEDGARYFAIASGPFLTVWDGVLSDL